jgi:hypothetical protein
MWLACALIVLFSVGFVLPCMLDITMTPDSEFTTLSKGMWLMVAGVFWIFGAAAWLIVGRPRRLPLAHRSGRYGATGFSQSEALMRHPATQSAGTYAESGNWLPEHRMAAPVGPDDDEAFLQELARRIREGREDS